MRLTERKECTVLLSSGRRGAGWAKNKFADIQKAVAMRIYILLLFITAGALHSVGGASFSQDDKKERAAFSLADIKYFHRFTKDDQHEYTPAEQEDLKAWKDMVTIHYYRKAKDGEALAATANAVLENYKAAKGMVLRTDSVPKTKDKEAEHLVVVVFGRPEFIEVAFARFRMHDGVGTAVIYSHRIYGKKIGNEMSKWLEKSGPDTEKSLMKWDSMPKPPVSK
jgi:hypothetical protein